MNREKCVIIIKQILICSLTRKKAKKEDANQVLFMLMVLSLFLLQIEN